MAKDKQAVRNTYPETILKRVRDGTHLLPYEDADDFLLLFEGLNRYGNPKTELDHLVAYQAAVLTWNILRYHDMNTGILRNYQRVALEKLLRTTSTSTMIVGGAVAENMMRSDIQQNIERWFADPAAKSAMKKKLEQAGYPPNAVETEAFMLALPSLGQNDKLLASAQKRLDAFWRKLEQTSSKDAAETLRSATEKVIAAKTSGQATQQKAS